MNDLETRVREALNDEIDVRPVGVLLDDVRRGARRQRTRRTTSVALVSVLAVAGLAFEFNAGRRDAAVPATPSHATHTGKLEIGDLSVSATGERFEAVRGGDDSRPLTEVWVQQGAAAWVHRGTVPDLTSEVAMAPDGTNGWAPGMTGVWSTHDGGRTWARVQLFAPPAAGGVGILTGPEVAWAFLPGADGAQAWRTPVGSDDWVPVTLPKLPASVQMLNVLPDSRVVLGGVDPVGGGIERVVVGDGTTWHRFAVPCYSVPELFGGHPSTRGQRCGLVRIAGRFEGQDLVSTIGEAATGSSADLGMVTSPGHPVGQVRSLYVSGHRAVVYSPNGRETAHLALAPHETLRQLAITGDQAVLSTSNARVFASDDGGLTWKQLP